MQVFGFPSAVFGTNCYVVAPSTGDECLVVDPGIDILDQLAQVLREHRLKPAAVLLTHGHLDHTYSVTPVCGAHGIAAYLHSDDTYRLRDPLAAMDPAVIAMLEQQFGRAASWAEPDDVVEVADGARLELAGLELDVIHAPGHTEGSVMFELPGAQSRTLITGDVLFAGSIGRTDLPGGDHAAMLRSLREGVLPRADDTVVLPGHGPQTTIGRERSTNPYLLQLQASGA